MENSTQLEYLAAMGIDVWVSREERRPIDCADEQHNEEITLNSVFLADWNTLQKEVLNCQHCVLCETRTQTVFGAGNINADWMLIGEAPGENEDLKGQPFVGQAGMLLTEMIRAIGLNRDDVYITNTIKCRPPENRNPMAEEIKACGHYLQRQIKLVKPAIILAVGRVAAQSLLETNESLAKLRGRQHLFNGIPLVVIYHPAYLLRALSEKRKAWQDLQLAIKQSKTKH